MQESGVGFQIYIKFYERSGKGSWSQGSRLTNHFKIALSIMLGQHELFPKMLFERRISLLPICSFFTRFSTIETCGTNCLRRYAGMKPGTHFSQSVL